MDLAVGAFIHAANTKSWMPEAVKTKTTAPSTRVSWQTNTAALVVQTQELLERERSKRKKQVVVIVDEAHLLRPSNWSSCGF